jgi:hypothetical protein
MFIRVAGSRIQLFRSNYIAEKKRGVQVLIGSFSKPYDFKTPEELQVGRKREKRKTTEVLTDSELQQLKDWLADETAKNKNKALKSSLELMAFSIADDAITIDETTPSTDQIKEIRTSIKKLSLALKRAEKRANKAH